MNGERETVVQRITNDLMPLLHDGYIVAVDKSQTNRRRLYGQIVVASHDQQGLIVSRLQRFDGTEVRVEPGRLRDLVVLPSAALVEHVAHL